MASLKYIYIYQTIIYQTVYIYNISIYIKINKYLNV